MSPVHDDSAESVAHHAQPQRFDWEALLRNTALVIVLLLLLWSVFNVQLPSASRLRDLIEAWGWAAGYVYWNLRGCCHDADTSDGHGRDRWVIIWLS